MKGVRRKNGIHKVNGVNRVNGRMWFSGIEESEW